ncbi:MAG: ubiquinol-cytochrome c reductase iron-sulfur subunit [Alphaproteobacteria bacterium]|jgi:ubiquinol-cytochrome c reductase iron-sulfur subunit|nr:ubiquinol-cytochrome c reductase iron-sulfur subunit [Rickettsiales bacterium]
MSHDSSSPDSERRDFIILTAQAMGALGAAAVIWPFVNSMNPSADVLALSSTEVDISPIAPGQEIKVMWRGKPVFIRHRTPEDIAAAEAVSLTELRDPQTDAERVKKGKEQWLVMVGVCTHLGCIPLGNLAGDYRGWFCPCHGSHYDTAGRIRKGPAPTNLVVPPFEFLSDTKVKIG